MKTEAKKIRARLLIGEAIEQSREDIANRRPMTEANVRFYLRNLDRYTKSENARARMANLAVSHGNATGRIAPEGVALYAAYAATFEGL